MGKVYTGIFQLFAHAGGETTMIAQRLFSPADFYTFNDILKMTGRSKSWTFNFLRRNGITHTCHSGIRHYDKILFDKVWAQTSVTLPEKGWITIEQVCNEFHMNRSFARLQLAVHQITRRTSGNTTYYSRQEIINGKGASGGSYFCSVQEAMNDYGMINNSKYHGVFKHFYEFCNGYCTFEQLSVTMCEQFWHYLLHAALSRITGKPLRRTTAAAYYDLFLYIMQIAYNDNAISSNLAECVSGIRAEGTIKTSLNYEELDRLFKTPCRHDVLRRSPIIPFLQRPWRRVVQPEMD